MEVRLYVDRYWDGERSVRLLLREKREDTEAVLAEARVAKGGGLRAGRAEESTACDGLRSSQFCSRTLRGRRIYSQPTQVRLASSTPKRFSQPMHVLEKESGTGTASPGSAHT